PGRTACAAPAGSATAVVIATSAAMDSAAVRAGVGIFAPSTSSFGRSCPSFSALARSDTAETVLHFCPGGAVTRLPGRGHRIPPYAVDGGQPPFAHPGPGSPEPRGARAH